MPGYVLDASLALAILLPDEACPVAEGEFLAMVRAGLEVPALWWLEVGNGLIMAERRGRLTAARRREVLQAVRDLGVATEPHGAEAGWDGAMGLAVQHGLSLYDACYLDLARRRRATLLTKDRALRRAAAAESVATLP